MSRFGLICFVPTLVAGCAVIKPSVEASRPSAIAPQPQGMPEPFRRSRQFSDNPHYQALCLLAAVETDRDSKGGREVVSLTSDYDRLAKMEEDGLAVDWKPFEKKLAAANRPRFERIRQLYLQAVDESAIRVLELAGATVTNHTSYFKDMIANYRAWGERDIGKYSAWGERDIGKYSAWGEHDIGKYSAWGERDIGKYRNWGGNIPRSVDTGWDRQVKGFQFSFSKDVGVYTRTVSSRIADSSKEFKHVVESLNATFVSLVAKEERVFMAHNRDGLPELKALVPRLAAEAKAEIKSQSGDFSVFMLQMMALRRIQMEADEFRQVSHTRAIEMVVTPLASRWTESKQRVSAAYKATKKNLSKGYHALKAELSAAYNTLKRKLGRRYSNLKSKLSYAYSSLKRTVSSAPKRN